MSAPTACVIDGTVIWKCTSHECPFVATREVYWPGQTAKKCNACWTVAKRIAEALGFELQAKELPALPRPEDDDTSIRFSLLELE